jgi:poly-gamma-glutamate synthesis protein (capsule biosynthesis protein)
MSNFSSTVSLIGVGDVMVARHDATLFDLVSSHLQAADIVFGNCEWPYSEEPGDTHPVEAHLNDGIDDVDLFVPGKPESVQMIGRAGFNVMSFANNHCLHSGYRVFLRTMALLRESAIEPVGAGVNTVEALRPVIIERNGTRIAFIACASALLPGTEAGRRTPGIAPLRRHSYFENPAWEMLGIDPKIKTLVNRDDLAALCTSIREARNTADVVIVSCHWGILEHRSAIGEYQREAAHAFIDAGADLILGHGPLVTKGIEVYRGKTIFYSLGKFLMMAPIPTDAIPVGVSVPFGEESRKGVVARVDIENGKIVRTAFTPCYSDEQSRPRLLKAGEDKFTEIVDDIRRVSAEAGLAPTLRVAGDRIAIDTSE